MLDLRHLAVADDHVGLPGEDRRDQLRDVGAAVLVVGVGVDDDVGAELQAGVEPGLEPRREPLVVGQPDDVLDPASRATATVRSVEPSSITSSSTAVEAVEGRGRSAIVAGSVSSSFRQGIWMINFKASAQSIAGGGGRPELGEAGPRGGSRSRPRGPGYRADPQALNSRLGFS